MRLIDADKLDVYEMRFRSALELQDYLDAQETIDPVRHGKWIISDGHVCCSECGEPNMEWNYCPHCGAGMQEGEKK